MENEMRLGIYEHYKGKRYEVIGIAWHSETLEEFVVYRALYDSEEFGDQALWVRPKEMFCGDVEIDGKSVPRFRYMDERKR
jgi:hypothetical protein